MKVRVDTIKGFGVSSTLRYPSPVSGCNMSNEVTCTVPIDFRPWCDDVLSGAWTLVIDPVPNGWAYSIDFENEADAIAFKLRWQ